MAIPGSTMKRMLSRSLQLRFYSAPADRSIPDAKQKYVPTSGTYPKGFLAGTAHAGVKPSNTKYDDIALVVSEQPCAAAGVFTRNRFKAAPVLEAAELLRARRNDGVRGVVINAGCANALTGSGGREDAVDMANVTDECFGESSGSGAGPRTLVMSTGVIGQRLPMDRIKPAIPKAYQALGSTHDHWIKAAQAICTTDTFPKLISRQFTLPSHPKTVYTITGMTKGAGMIHPNMGTLLGVVCTDARIDPAAMKPYLHYASNRSFNSISIDGDTSTNDAVAFFANGAAAPKNVKPLGSSAFPRDGSKAFNPSTMSADDTAFGEIMVSLMTDLAKLVVRDGEGATKFVTVRVQCPKYLTARRAAKSIATSPLVKTALYGKDANWGRILCAIGNAHGIMDDVVLYRLERREESNASTTNTPEGDHVKDRDTSVSFVPSDGSEELEVVSCGEPQAFDEARAKEILEMEDIEILVKIYPQGWKELHLREAVYWTCDFSHEYVTINGDYRT